MVKRETYVLVDLTAYRNIQDYKYKQFLHEEFCTMVNLISFFTRAPPTLYRAIEGAATPKVITLTHTEERISYQIYKYYNCQNYKTYVFTTFIVRFFNGSKLNCQGYICATNLQIHKSDSPNEGILGHQSQLLIMFYRIMNICKT